MKDLGKKETMLNIWKGGPKGNNHKKKKEENILVKKGLTPHLLKKQPRPKTKWGPGSNKTRGGKGGNKKKSREKIKTGEPKSGQS